MVKQRKLLSVPYYLWILLFVIFPVLLLLFQSFRGLDGSFTLVNIQTYFTSRVYLTMTLQSFIYAFLITVLTLTISYPAAYFLTRTKNKQLWLLVLILPTWMNILLKTYAFIGILSQTGMVNQLLDFMGLGAQPLLFTRISFLIVATYIEIPFMLLPVFNAIDDINDSMVYASRDLGASEWKTFSTVILPLSLSGVRSGVQAVFIPSLSLFMLTRLIAGNRVITLGTAIEQHFLVTQNWGMGSTMGIVLIIIMFAVMYLTRKRKRGVAVR
ncbi:ABC transporter permease [Alkalibacterium olivapovliticus]|uniref:Spermidine/putrescine transport system permease protein n=1 Tax=Alkalibacterium olivapovliticus TaxID=99907 RepID=A0A2T0W9R4_9LACT|nr:ABC transporter permease [Alkalibacterium olivapovliticus]PRY83455.1 spermidine/putrescine transport system permease protein [Alkalibacterium olivapovliticus]